MHTILKQLKPYKNDMTTFDDSSDNDVAVRIFRDMTTDIYTEVFFDNNQVLEHFLDYTFHVLYSTIMKSINQEIINHNIANQDDHVKPLTGLETIYLLFKGGTLMSMLYKRFFNDIIQNNQTTTIEEIQNHFGVQLKNFKFDFDSNTEIGNNDTFDNFMNNIIMKKFAISDTDYSLLISTITHERWLILHKFATILLGKGFDIMTNNFDMYYNNVLLDVNENYDMTIPNTTDDESFKCPTYLIKLKEILDDNDVVQQIIDSNDPNNILNTYPLNNELNININCGDFFDFLPDFINQNINNETQIYLLYYQIEFITLLTYIKYLNPNYMPLHDLNNIYNNLVNRVDSLVTKKLNNLKQANFYTRDKIQLLKQKLSDKYTAIQAGFINDPNGKDKRFYDPKIEKLSRTNKLQPDVNIYELNPNNTYTPDSFSVNPRVSGLVLSENNAINNLKMMIFDGNTNTPNTPNTPNITNITNNYKTYKRKRVHTIPEYQSLNKGKIHYMTYNTIIAKYRYNQQICTDFDLMRSKFNVELENGFIRMNGEDIEAKIPSEFIDVSIPRYYDSSLKHFSSHLKHNDNMPCKIKIGNTLLYCYSPEEILIDLQYVITCQNSIEPWLDKKYAKRIIRIVVFLIIVYKSNNSLDNLKKFFDLFNKIFLYTNNAIELPYDDLAKFITRNNTELPDNMTKYLKITHTNYEQWIENKITSNIINLDITNENLELLLNNVIFWLFSYYLSNDKLVNIVNKIGYLYLQKTNHTNITINDTRLKFQTLVNILFDYGYKLLYGVNKMNIQMGGTYNTQHTKKYRLKL